MWIVSVIILKYHNYKNSNSLTHWKLVWIKTYNTTPGRHFILDIFISCKSNLLNYNYMECEITIFSIKNVNWKFYKSTKTIYDVSILLLIHIFPENIFIRVSKFTKKHSVD